MRPPLVRVCSCSGAIASRPQVIPANRPRDAIARQQRPIKTTKTHRYLAHFHGLEKFVKHKKERFCHVGFSPFPHRLRTLATRALPQATSHRAILANNLTDSTCKPASACPMANSTACKTAIGTLTRRCMPCSNTN